MRNLHFKSSIGGIFFEFVLASSSPGGIFEESQEESSEESMEESSELEEEQEEQEDATEDGGTFVEWITGVI